jgi:hypothetical protein
MATATRKRTTRRRTTTRRGVSGIPSVKQLTNFNGIQNDAIKVVSILAGMLVGKLANDNVKGLVSKVAPENGGPVEGFLRGSNAGRLAGTAIDTVKSLAPALLLTMGGFALKKNVKNNVAKDMALGMMAYGGVSLANDAFKFNVINKLQGLGRPGGLKGLYPYVDRPRQSPAYSAPEVATPASAAPVNGFRAV